MNISNKKLKELVNGAIRFEENDGWLLPHRFTKKIVDYYEIEDQSHYKRAKASAGMTLDFTTNSEAVSFDARIFSASSRKNYSFDVYVDGKMEYHFANHDVEQDETNISFELKSGTKRVTIYLPCLFGTEIKNFVIDDGANIEPVKKDRSIAIFGDSITQGYTTEFTSLTYANSIARSLDANVLNQAIGGAKFKPKNLDEDLNFEADTVIVAYGTNDWSYGEDIEKNASDYFGKLRKIYPTQKMYVILPIWRKDLYDPKPNIKMGFFEMRELIRSIASGYNNVTIIDSIDFVPHFSEFFEDERLHPNDLGFMMYAENLKKIIK